MAELYALDNITRRFGEREVLNIPEMRLETGVIYGLLGPNGAGKTTLMRILSFMDAPSSGAIHFMGETIRPDQAARCRARVVWVPQSPVMFTGSLLYNVEYPMRLKGAPRAARRARAMALLETVDLARLAASPAHRLSGGEAQRGSIARALAAGAEVILFDEPTASVDFRSRGDIIRLIRNLNEERGLSVIVTTHDAALAAELCRERIVLFDGRIVPSYPGSGSDAPPAAPPFSARFDGTAVLIDASGPETATARATAGPTAAAGVTATGGETVQATAGAMAQATTRPTAIAAKVTGLAEHPAGVLVQLMDVRDAPLSVLFTAPEDREAARRLSLGLSLDIRFTPAPQWGTMVKIQKSEKDI